MTLISGEIYYKSDVFGWFRSRQYCVS